MDTLSSAKRSWVMSRVKSEDTKPELRVRSLLFSLGLRFRLHKSGLPGRPDVVLPKLKTALFVHGCFWHRHKGCRDSSTPSSNSAYWQAKFTRNVERDARNKKDLRKLGWRVVVVWECELKSLAKLERRLRRLLLSESSASKISKVSETRSESLPAKTASSGKSKKPSSGAR